MLKATNPVKRTFAARAVVAATAVVVLAVASGVLYAQDMKPPFGAPQDVKYAAALWKALQKADLVGPNAIKTIPYPGQSPHGMVLESLTYRVRVKGHTGEVWVKRNYGGPNLKPSMVQQNRAKYLKAITVMFKRQAGYDSETNDWFWAKYLPGGSLDKNPKGMQLAGKVAKGMDQGCIACHKNGGDDLLFLTDASRIDK